MQCRIERDVKVRWRFVVGSIPNPELQTALQKEQQAYNDFHVLSMPETYDNLVLKV